MGFVFMCQCSTPIPFTPADIQMGLSRITYAMETICVCGDYETDKRSSPMALVHKRILMQPSQKVPHHTDLTRLLKLFS